VKIFLKMLSLLGGIASTFAPSLVEWGKDKLIGWLNPSKGNPKQLGDMGGLVNTFGSLARSTGRDIYNYAG